MKYKLDISIAEEKGSHASKVYYFGSIIFNTSIESDLVIEYIIHGGGKFSRDGFSIKSYIFEEYTIIEIEDYFQEGAFYKDLIYSNKKFDITNSVFEDSSLQKDKVEFLIFGEEYDIEFEDNHKDLYDVFNQYKTGSSLIKLESIFEWGASGFSESFIASILADLSTSIIKKLVSLGYSKKEIIKFRISDKIKNLLNKEYHIRTESLVLISYTEEKGLIKAELRNLMFKYILVFKIRNFVIFKRKKLINLKSESLNNFI